MGADKGKIRNNRCWDLLIFMKKKFSINQKIWKWPGDSGWHFVTLDRKLSAGIRDVYARGHVPVVVKVGKSIWGASLLWHNKEKVYILCITKKVRVNEGLFPGDEIRASVMIK